MRLSESGPARGVRRFAQGRRADWLAIGLYVALVIVGTLPTALRLNSVVYGPATDNLYYVWLIWWRKYSLLNGLDYWFLSLSQAPFGTDMVYRIYPGLINSLGVLAIPFGAVAAYNLMILGGVALSGCLAYVLARQFSRSRVASFAAGLVFAFSPYAVTHALAHVDLSQQWLVPLSLLAFLRLQRKQTVVAALTLAAALGLTLYMHAYYAYFVAVALLTLAGVEAAARFREGGWRAVFDLRRVGLYALAAVGGIVLYLPELLAVRQALIHGPSSPLRSHNAFGRANEWFFYLSARPWTLLLPPVHHPFLGGLSSAFDTQVLQQLPPGDYVPPVFKQRFALDSKWFLQTASPVTSEGYLGYVVLAVAGYGVWQWRRGTRGIEAEKPVAERLVASPVPYFVPLVVVALLFSMPPFIPVGAPLSKLWEPLRNVFIPMPSLLTLAAAPPLRAAGRFVMLAMLSLAMLVSVGLDQLLARAASPGKRVAVMGAFLALLAAEFAYLPETTPIAPQPEHAWLARQPRDTIVAVYPYGDAWQAAMQRVHELPVIDGLGFDSGQVWDNLFQIGELAVGELDEVEVGPKLAALGARYVVNGGDSLDETPPGLSPLFATETAQVYEVLAEPAPLVVLHTLRDGLWTSDAAWAWQGEAYAMYVWNPLNEAATADIELRLAEGAPQGILLATRLLTPAPEFVYVSGLLTPNPVNPPDYPPEAVEAEETAGGLVFESMVFQPGETTLTLRWADLPEGGEWPAIIEIESRLDGGEP